MKDKENLKAQMVAEIIRQKGFKGVACQAIGLNPRTFRQWMAEDEEFKAAVNDAVEISREWRDEAAEKALFDLVEAKDTTAVIFYNKTRNKYKGYSERMMPQPKEEPKPEANILPSPEQPRVSADEIKKKITGKKTYIVKLLKEQGKYSAELSMQVKMAATLLVRADILSEEIFSADHHAVNVEISREGNTRESISPKEKLFLDLTAQAQKALRALGMNTDSKERKTDNDDFGKFFEEFKDNDDDE